MKLVLEVHQDAPDAQPRLAEVENVLRRSAIRLPGWPRSGGAAHVSEVV